MTEITSVSANGSEAPPAGEELHLPGPSVVPVINAVGISLVLVGLTLGWVVVAIGTVIFLVSTVIWIRDTVRDIDELPLEHH